MGMYGGRKTIARYPCTPPLTVEKLGERISSSIGSCKEIAGSKKKEEPRRTIMMTRKIVKSRGSSFSRAKLEASMDGLGLCTARDESKSRCWCVLKS